MVSYTTMSTPANVETSTLTGKVKWFNNKAGFGFITVCDGELSSKDIFVHYSSIQVNNSQYKYLVQGEYVDFLLTKPENSTHEYHAVNVCGIKGGSLMCETRRQNFVSRSVRPSADEREDTREAVSRDIEKRPARRTLSPRVAAAVTENDGFQTVSRKRAEPKTPRKTREATVSA